MAGVLVVLVFVDTFLTGYLLSEHVKHRKVISQLVRDHQELMRDLGSDDAR